MSKTFRHMQLMDLIEKVNRISIEAGKVIMEIYNGESSYEVTTKSDDSPLTKADRAANELICNALKKITPDIPIISEENKEIPYEERKTFTAAWLVDPVDGTKEFLKRNGEFTVNIALIQNSEIVLGSVYVPVAEELFYAVKGKGAFMQNQSNDGVPKLLKAPLFKLTDKGLSVVCSRSHLNEETTSFISQLDEPEKVSKGSSLKFLILAQGGAHIYPRLAPTMEWDTGAAQIILEESGGKVINNETKLKLTYNKQNLRNPHFIAYANLCD